MADFQFRTRPATVASIVATGDSDGSGGRFEGHSVVKAETISHQVDALSVCPLKAA